MSKVKYIVEVEELDVGVGNEFNPAQYPHKGVFSNSRMQQWYWVTPELGIWCMSSTMISSGLMKLHEDHLFVPTPKAPELILSLNDALKLMAVSKHAELAAELIKKE